MSDHQGLGLSVQQAVARATEMLSEAGLGNTRFEALALMGQTLGASRAELYMRWYDTLPREALDQFWEQVRRRSLREPFAYIVGSRAFYDLDIQVDPRVLIPRPETEILVERVLAWVDGQDCIEQVLRVADLGTGSGVIAATLARHIPRASVLAVDISPESLVVAKGNLELHGLSERVALVQGDLFSGVRGVFDIVAANLPYLPHDRIAELEPEVRDHEPHLALDGGRDGLDLVRRLLEQLPEHLASPGLCILEIDEGQGQLAADAAVCAFPRAKISVLQDYAGLERFVCIER